MKKRIDKKPWGKEEIFVLNERVSVKIINIDKGKRLSLQKHKHRDELLRVVEGKALITIGNIDNSGNQYINSQNSLMDNSEKRIPNNRIIHKNRRYKKDGEVFVKRGTLHRIKSLSDSLKVLEISFGKFDKNDIERVEDDYGRVGDSKNERNARINWKRT